MMTYLLQKSLRQQIFHDKAFVIIIKRAEQILTELEEKLGLAKRFSDMKQGFAEIIRAADSIEKISENLPQEYKANIKNYTKIIKAASERLSGE